MFYVEARTSTGELLAEVLPARCPSAAWESFERLHPSVALEAGRVAAVGAAL